MNSLEKLDQALAGAGAIEPEDEQTARMLQMLAMVKPVLGTMIPNTPQGLDAQLLGISLWLLRLVSDTDDPNTVGFLSTALTAIADLQAYNAEGVS